MTPAQPIPNLENAKLVQTDSDGTRVWQEEGVYIYDPEGAPAAFFGSDFFEDSDHIERYITRSGF